MGESKKRQPAPQPIWRTTIRVPMSVAWRSGAESLLSVNGPLGSLPYKGPIKDD